VRLLFAGTPAIALPSLQVLLNSPAHEVVGVLTRPPAPSGRGRTLTPSPVAQLADEAGVPVFSPDKPADPEFLAAAAALDVDCCPVVAYGSLLRVPTLDLPRVGWVNLHFSLLPAWRGAAPVQQAILHGDEFTGASTFLIGPGLDDGPVFGVLTERVRPDDTSGSLLERLARAGSQLLLATMDGISDGSLTAVPQAADGVSLAPKLSVEDAQIRFDQPAAALDRRVRACTPAPGAWTQFRGERLKLGPVALSADPAAAADLAPGELRVAKSVVEVGTATTAVLLQSVQPPGKRPMAAADWARGLRLASGERLG
jgi:methionyl-tRNA formyltransferase